MRNYVDMPNAEWLEADGRGGFSSGTVGGWRTRRYHALLLPAVTPPTGRFVLVGGCEVWVETGHRSEPLSTQYYAPGIRHPDGFQRLESFTPVPWPAWTFRLQDGTRIGHELFVAHGTGQVCLRWRVLDGESDHRLYVRPLMSGRDYHALHRENPAFRFESTAYAGGHAWFPYHGLPGIHVHTNGRYRYEPLWYRNFLYTDEQARGLDCLEDLASPGVFSWDLRQGEAVWILSAISADRQGHRPDIGDPVDVRAKLASDERSRRQRFSTPLHRAADAYLVSRGSGQTIIAGYPWFTDWGRDTFIALRGLCLATGQLDAARRILLDWSGHVSQGMLPNRFPDLGQEPEFNSVDASLWFIVAVHDYLAACADTGASCPPRDQASLQRAVETILDGYAQGTRYGIRLDDDGLLAAGVPGVQLTWMDAKVGDWVVTPRIGKPVEVQALWLNALRFAAAFSPRWHARLERGREAFVEKFWNAADRCLFDVIDVDHQRGAVDRALRPNQILAVGGLPWPVLEGRRARRVVEAVESQLWTPLGLRSLAPGDPGYRGRYQGGVRDRDGAYHQGTVWPWLLGPFVEAWLRIRDNAPAAKREARQRFVQPLLEHLDAAGLGHVSEIADGDAPHAAQGCPFQAWSLGELLRLMRLVGDTAAAAHDIRAHDARPTCSATL